MPKIKWNWHDMATLECGYCLYATTHTLKKLKKHNNVELRRPQFCYMMLIVKPFAKFNSTNGK